MSIRNQNLRNANRSSFATRDRDNSLTGRIHRFIFRHLPKMVVGGFVGVGIFIIGGLILNGAGLLAQATSTNCVVTGKDRVATEDGSDMRIYTENCGTLRVADSLVHMQFASADMYGSIMIGEAYTFEHFGYRIPILSAFPTITAVHPVN